RKVFQEYETATKNVHSGGYRRVTTNSRGESRKAVERGPVGEKIWLRHNLGPSVDKATHSLSGRISMVELGLMRESNCCMTGLEWQTCSGLVSSRYGNEWTGRFRCLHAREAEVALNAGRARTSPKQHIGENELETTQSRGNCMSCFDDGHCGLRA